jgi:hypothetical protein
MHQNNLFPTTTVVCGQCYQVTCNGHNGSAASSAITVQHRLHERATPSTDCFCDGCNSATAPTVYYCSSPSCDYDLCHACFLARSRNGTESRGAKADYLRHFLTTRGGSIDRGGTARLRVESKVDGVVTVESLPTREVVEFVHECDVLFSFASRTGGLDGKNGCCGGVLVVGCGWVLTVFLFFLLFLVLWLVG